MNKIVSLAARLSADKKLNILSERQFWEAMRRPDLADIPEAHLPCVYLEGLHIAQRAIARRAGEEPKARPQQLTQFTHRFTDGSGRQRFRYWHLHPTRGWRRERIDQHEASHYQRRNGVPLLDCFPLSKRFGQ